MRLRRIIHASFEDSLNLLDDTGLSLLANDSEKTPRRKPVLTTIFLIFGFLFLYLLPLITTKAQKGQMGYSTVPKPTVNFLPFSLFWVLQAIYLIIWGYSLFKRSKHTEAFYALLNTILFLVWLILEMDLFFLTLLFVPVTAIGTALLFLGVITIVSIITRARICSLELLLFDTEHSKNKLDEWIKKLLNFVVKYGGVVLFVGIIWKFVFPNTGITRTDFIGFIGIVAMWVVMNIGAVVAGVYLLAPGLLFAYYLCKYPEEYRTFDGKTQQEWYGEKYFKKHIKGTEKEKKDE